MYRGGEFTDEYEDSHSIAIDLNNWRDEFQSNNVIENVTYDTTSKILYIEYINSQYTYFYDEEDDGWSVSLTDSSSTDPVTSKLCTSINGKPIVSMAYMFENSQATSIDLSSFDTSNVTDMNFMFAESQATTLDLSSFDISNVTNMSNMFDKSQATSIDLSSFDTSKVTNMYGMFQVSQATSIDLSSFDTSKVTNMYGMFNYSKATTLDLSGFDTSEVTTMQSMFEGSQVTTLDLSSFDTSKVTNMADMFGYSRKLDTIYVSDKFVLTALDADGSFRGSTNMFKNATNLIGGAGTTYNSRKTNKEYAHIDGGTSNPGYFTRK